jgi:hypothetical protein
MQPRADCDEDRHARCLQRPSNKSSNATTIRVLLVQADDNLTHLPVHASHNTETRRTRPHRNQTDDKNGDDHGYAETHI